MLHRLLTDYKNSSKTTCWRCHESIKSIDLFCSFCNTVQPAGKIDPYQTFELSISLDIAEKKLHQNYLSLQKKLHPDKFLNASTTEKEFAKAQSELVNNAYKVLKEPVKRAQLIYFVLFSEPFPTENNIADTALLFEILNLREELEEIQNQNEQIEEFINKIKYFFDEAWLDLKASFEENNKTNALTALHMLSYYKKMIQDAEEILFKDV
jgi:molecular chaperone HscB